VSVIDINAMPRGGPDMSWLDRRLQTDVLEYLDRDDTDREKRSVIHSLGWLGERLKLHEKFAERTLSRTADVPEPKILELGSGHGALARAILDRRPGPG
jgi:hypothetical protein